MKMAGSIIWTRKQFEKTAKDQLSEFTMNPQNNMVTKQTELINDLQWLFSIAWSESLLYFIIIIIIIIFLNDSKQFREKLRIIDSKYYEVKRENEILKSKVSVAETNVDPFD